jgi:hypothetical protein
MMEYVVQMRAGINRPKINMEYIMDTKRLGIWAFGRKGNILILILILILI